MGYVLATKSGTVYTVQETDRENIMMLSGGKFCDAEIYKPTDMISKGRPFQATFTPSAENRAAGIAGRTLQTSPIVSIHAVQPKQASRAAQAESRFGDILDTSNQNDKSYQI